MSKRNRLTRFRVLLAAVLCCSVAAVVAATSPLQFTASISSAILSIETGLLPKGWFSSKNTLDRTKSDLVTTITLGATTCSEAKGTVTQHSTTLGNFDPALNSQGHVTAYSWDTTIDLSGYQNHWNNHFHCDGTVEVHGCAQAVPVSVGITAYAANGSCHTYVNDAGQTVCASDSASLTLSAVQDPDVVDPCEQSCGIGQCVSACEAQCDATHTNKNDRQQCKKECPCDCKAQLPSTCPPHNECE